MAFRQAVLSDEYTFVLHVKPHPYIQWIFTLFVFGIFMILRVCLRARNFKFLFDGLLTTILSHEQNHCSEVYHKRTDRKGARRLLPAPWNRLLAFYVLVCRTTKGEFLV